ncbi:MAG: aspartate aminotransferase family protein [Saprospiraceae bacterium]
MNQRQFFLQHIAQTSAFPLMLEIVKAEGMYLIDANGKKYMDLIAGIGVSALGHCNPAVVEASKRQLDRYLHTMVYGEFVLSPQVELASLLTKHLPDNLDSVFLVNSGTEATEGAMKLAKRYTGRTEFIAMRNAYHGSTQGAMSLNSDPYFTQAFRPLIPGIKHINFNNFEDLLNISTSTAAVVVETVQAESGIHAPKSGYLEALKARCTATGTLLIVDEIQTGMGRTGHLWAFEAFNFVPDILLLAKGLGGGMPIGAFIASRKMMSSLSDHPILGHITTFGGHPVSCAAAVATLKELIQKPYIQDVKEKENLFKSLLKHPEISDIRSAGLMMAVQLRDFEYLQKVIAICLQKGLLTDWFLFHNRSMRIAPPLIIEKDEIEQACKIILEALDEANN